MPSDGVVGVFFRDRILRLAPCGHACVSRFHIDVAQVVMARKGAGIGLCCQCDTEGYVHLRCEVHGER